MTDSSLILVPASDRDSDPEVLRESRWIYCEIWNRSESIISLPSHVWGFLSSVL